MRLATYTDGRPLDLDETGQRFALGGAPVTADQVTAFDGAGHLTWGSQELRTWFYQSFAQPAAVQQPRRKRWIWVVVSLVVLGCAIAGCAAVFLAGPSGTNQGPSQDTSGPAWAMDGQNARHTGQSPYPGPGSDKQLWTVNIARHEDLRLRWAPGPPMAAVGSDGTIYIGNDVNGFQALKPDGKVKWELETRDEVACCPAIALDGTIYFGDATGTVYAVSPDGAKKWEFAARGPVEGGPMIGPDGSVYVATVDGQLLALSPGGKEKWHLDMKRTLMSAPAIGPDGTIYVLDDNLYAVTPDGKLKWQFEALEPGSFKDLTGAPAVASDGTIYVPAGDKMFAVSPDGSKKWELAWEKSDKLYGVWYSTPAVGADGTVYFGGVTKLLAVSPSGQKKWELDGNGAESSPSIGSDGTIYFGGNDLRAVSADGKEKWTFDPDVVNVNATAIGTNKTIYFACYKMREDRTLLFAVGGD
jgi:outer membrane protein assembly factor BamB